MAGGSGERSLQETPTWAVAIVCGVFVIISIIIEHGIHSLGKFFKKRKKNAMNEALEKIKAELMLLGFISLLLTVGTSYIVKICIPTKLGDTFLPCEDNKKKSYDKGGSGGGGDDRRKLLSYAEEIIWRRALASGDEEEDYCAARDKVSLISYKGVHQLHIFIFVLAVLHVVYSVILVVLGQAKMMKWKGWEAETSSLEYQYTTDPERFRFSHQTSFVKRHARFSSMPGAKWIVAFFRQFFGSISKVDYMAIRTGFINANVAPNGQFNFHKYIKRSMEDDFKKVLGISIPLWSFALIFLLLNVYKWHTLVWLSMLPLLILLLVGTKLELVIMEMAQQIQDRTVIVRGAPVVQPSNQFFWFNRPRWILFLIHFTLFQNAFQIAFFLFTLIEFRHKTCFHEKLPSVVTRVVLGVGLQILCSYITFPLYALVTQMGSHMKKSIFEEQTSKALKNWHKTAKDNQKKLRKSGEAASPGYACSENSTPSRGSSPLHLLHNHKSSGMDQSESIAHNSLSCLPEIRHEDLEASDPELRQSDQQDRN
ncbi:hypothetical protein POM88_016841 [Heracleum sosnowskyi]|uniref:MLO-like protein n=1 Tax=Heracleum sosnowskyi TaxID=360622 RepID=A0AAD8IPQ5_9APIA|nr:hypothetical protein POM88_016841 [Heracleum sosnowskyi]